MCSYFSIGFVDFMLKRKSLLEYTNLFSIKIFSIIKKMKNYIALFAVSMENLQNLKYHTF